MTLRLNAYHETSVALRVHRHEQAGDLYHRLITLTPPGSEHVVEVGVVRVHLNYTDEAVRQEILERETPLGDILTQHNVLRRIEPRWFVRCDAGNPVLALFNRPLGGAVYGRLGVIHCNDEPAIELLEVVADDRETRS
jgi:hypothetical protein